MSMQWADLDSDDSDDEAIVMATQHAGLNDGTVQVNIYTLLRMNMNLLHEHAKFL